MKIENKVVGGMPTFEDYLIYENCELNIPTDRRNGPDNLYLKHSTFKAEAPFRVWRFSLEEGSNAHLHFKERAKVHFPITDIIVSDSTLHLSSDVDIDIEEMNTYKSLDIRVSGDSKVYLDLRNFNLDKIYLDLSNLSEDSFTHILLKDGVKVWVNLRGGRVASHNLRIEGKVEVEVTSM